MLTIYLDFKNMIIFRCWDFSASWIYIFLFISISIYLISSSYSLSHGSLGRVYTIKCDWRNDSLAFT